MREREREPMVLLSLGLPRLLGAAAVPGFTRADGFGLSRFACEIGARGIWVWVHHH